MDHDQKLAIFTSQVKNVRALERGIRQIRRSINAALRRDDRAGVACHTRLYAIMFCAWAEANFSKVLHTPHGFSPAEIIQIKEQYKYGIAESWKKAVDLGLARLPAQRGSFGPNARLKLMRAIDTHVFEPSRLRNKLAHGQWEVALNRETDAVEPEMTSLIARIDIVTIEGWLLCHRELALLVESLVESPKKTFIRDWYGAVEKLEEAMKTTAIRTLDDHIAILDFKVEAAAAAAEGQSNAAGNASACETHGPGTGRVCRSSGVLQEPETPDR